MAADPRPQADQEHRETNGDGHGPSPRTVVVGYDGSPHARAALTYAAERVGPEGRLVATYAYSAPPEWFGTPYYDRSREDHRKHGQEVLDGIDAAELGGVEVVTDLREGPPAQALVAAARAHGADEIAAGSRGFGRFRAALGSTSHALLHETDRPVVVVPDRRSREEVPHVLPHAF
jgi:nucleotide-binding universal stress UspA family protein